MKAKAVMIYILSVVHKIIITQSYNARGVIVFAVCKRDYYQPSNIQFFTRVIGTDVFSGGVSRLRVNNNGNIGIGTNSPSEKLDVRGLIKIPLATNEKHNSPGIVALSNDDFLYDGEYINHYGFGFHTFNDGNGTSGRNAYISGYFGVDIFSGGASRFRINNNGKVGIGTTIPDSDALLTVAGNISAREIKVTATAGGADFVFADDYQLPKLEAVAAFVKQNKHLPEIPSAAEMEANGLHLAEMNIKLLQKVEELTLYAIAQENKLATQQEAIAAQQAQLAEKDRQLQELLRRMERLEKMMEQ